VTQNTQDKNEAAEERSKDTRRFARQVRSANRRKYTTEEKIHIALEGLSSRGHSQRTVPARRHQTQ